MHADIYISSVNIMLQYCFHTIQIGVPLAYQVCPYPIHSAFTFLRCYIIFNVVEQHVQLSHGFVQAFSSHLNTKHTLSNHLLLTCISIMIMDISCMMFELLLDGRSSWRWRFQKVSGMWSNSSVTQEFLC